MNSKWDILVAIIIAYKYYLVDHLSNHTFYFYLFDCQNIIGNIGYVLFYVS